MGTVPSDVPLDNLVVESGFILEPSCQAFFKAVGTAFSYGIKKMNTLVGNLPCTLVIVAMLPRVFGDVDVHDTAPLRVTLTRIVRARKFLTRFSDRAEHELGIVGGVNISSRMARYRLT